MTGPSEAVLTIRFSLTARASPNPHCTPWLKRPRKSPDKKRVRRPPVRLRVEYAAMQRTLLFLLVLSSLAAAQTSPGSKETEAVFPDARALYLDLHQHPELSGHEVQTAATLAAKLRTLGYDVTERVGGTGIVAILKNGIGSTIMLRTELDALPVEEKTGLPYASKVRTKDA